MFQKIQCPECGKLINSFNASICDGSGSIVLKDTGDIISDLIPTDIDLMCPECHSMVATGLDLDEVEAWLKEHVVAQNDK